MCIQVYRLKLRHMLIINRLMYHHHIVTRKKEETIYKMYKKQSEEPLKGDWTTLIKKDFEFIGIERNDQEISSTPREVYRKKIKKLVEASAFTYMMNIKEGLTKLSETKYDKLGLQSYLRNPTFSREEQNLLYALRSRSHPAKSNYKKMHLNGLKCSFGCNSDENQYHIFQQCQFLKSNKNENVYTNMFGEEMCQKEAITKLLVIENRRLYILSKVSERNTLPGGQRPGPLLV